MVKTYKHHDVIRDISFTVAKSDFAVLIGPSGCGKTTILKMINRLLQPTSGTILINGEDIKTKNVFRLRRNIGYVIQSVGLFPHLTIRENIELVPSLERRERSARRGRREGRGPPEAAEKSIGERTAELLELVGLAPEKYLDRYPVQLSGGQQQRVGVARAFALDPEIVLMDEPFSALDPITREQLQDELSELQARLRKTIVFVTHDMDEAIKLGNKICIVNKGRILQYDTPEAVLKNPVDEFVAKFVGKHRIWTAPELIHAEDIMIPTPVVAHKDATLLRCIETMHSRGVDSILIIDAAGRLEGALYAEDAREPPDYRVPAGSVMRTVPYAASSRTSILEIIRRMKEMKASAVPVVEDHGKLVGIITKSSLVTTLSSRYFEEA
ncbi:MAG: ABC transporter ATP-binding protein [Spirochaetaceae bacterium]|nr:ABC transporter ATP-binding protein [Spirochaetaceae bacterium]